mmetsp:Transcript_19721/g.74625  ORF Transcript_19721/g.74625 Transcript_19721/m.74625 type:complete len:306 (+) Transcript_19721:1087-2004(+)
MQRLQLLLHLPRLAASVKQHVDHDAFFGLGPQDVTEAQRVIGESREQDPQGQAPAGDVDLSPRGEKRGGERAHVLPAAHVGHHLAGRPLRRVGGEALGLRRSGSGSIAPIDGVDPALGQEASALAHRAHEQLDLRGLDDELARVSLGRLHGQVLVQEDDAFRGHGVVLASVVVRQVAVLEHEPAELEVRGLLRARAATALQHEALFALAAQLAAEAAGADLEERLHDVRLPQRLLAGHFDQEVLDDLAPSVHFVAVALSEEFGVLARQFDALQLLRLAVAQALVQLDEVAVADADFPALLAERHT